MNKFDFIHSFLSCCSFEELEELKEIICQEIAKRQEETVSLKIEIEETNLEMVEPSFDKVENNESQIQIRDCRVMLERSPLAPSVRERKNAKKSNKMKSSEENIHQCKFCEKQFSNKSDKTDHEQVHKPFECQICGLRFTLKKSKTRHEH